MDRGVRNYLVVTGGYWAFTVTDGAIRMLVVLYFHLLGYSPFEVALLFLFYEFFGVVTNLVGGWLGARIGLNLTMHFGMGLQVIALAMLTAPDTWLSVPYVMAAQALSGIAKDLNKMSAKASVKTLVPQGSEDRLFKWVAVLTGSKNTLKGAGYFAGAALLELVEFRGALGILASMLALILIVTAILLPGGIGKTEAKARFSQVFSSIPAINTLSAARFFLFGSRDVWFVVALPVFLYDVLGWSFTGVGSFLALWIIGYGFIQALSPRFYRRSAKAPDGGTALGAVLTLSILPAVIALLLSGGIGDELILIVGLAFYGIVFAFNSAVHSFLILAYSDQENVSMNVGFYYMSNAGGRLVGTVLSGLVYQQTGLEGCLWLATAFLIAAALISMRLPRTNAVE